MNSLVFAHAATVKFPMIHRQPPDRKLTIKSVRAAAFVFFCLFVPGRAADAQRTTPWNVIAIVTDDQAEWAMGAYGNQEIVTPNMDKLAADGVRFTNSIIPAPVCTPSRISYLTGLYPMQIGFDDLPYRAHPNLGLPRGVPTWPRVLKKHGYTTGLIGKWHLGRLKKHHPTNFGIDHFFGFPHQASAPMDPVLEQDGRPKQFEGALPDILTDDAMTFIERNRNKPFALLLHYRAPHAPHSPVPQADRLPFLDLDPIVPIVDPADAELDDDQEPADPEAIALHEKLLKRKMITYYESIHSVDRNLGRLVSKLDELNLADRTIILFMSDNGYMFGHRGLKGKAGAQVVRNHTTLNDNISVNLFEHSLRVPLVVRWPGVVEPGTTIDQMVSNIDIFPSVLGMLGIDEPLLPEQRGLDFTPLLKGKNTEWRDTSFAAYNTEEILNIEFIRAVRTERWKLVYSHFNAGQNHLYDLENDPEEMHNLYYRTQGDDAYREIRKDLLARLAQWEAEVHDVVPEIERLYQKDREAARQYWDNRKWQ